MDKSRKLYQFKSARREILKSSLAGALALPFFSAVAAQEALSVSQLRGNIHLISGAGANILVAVGPDSVLVVDGGLPNRADEVLREIDRLAEGKPVAALFNSNFRPEHCGLNGVLGAQGVDILAHENTRLWQNNDFYVAWEDRQYHPMPVAAQANKTFYKTGSMRLGSETVDYGWISQFHTDGDIYIYFRNANVLFMGDMLTVGAYPLLDFVTGGWIGGAQENTSALLAMADEETLLIPSHGEPQQRQALELQEQMLNHAYNEVADAYRTGRSLKQFMASEPMADFNGVYGDPELFVRLLYRGTWYHVPGRAIRGII